VPVAPDRSFLAWPFFTPEHSAWADDLAAWADSELPALVDHENVDASCQHLVKALGSAGWLRAAVPDDQRGDQPYDVRTLCLARETLGYREGRGSETGDEWHVFGARSLVPRNFHLERGVRLELALWVLGCKNVCDL
jgi:alkylation response protein AidB-like acyl-CoA dehydrogenase